MLIHIETQGNGLIIVQETDERVTLARDMILTCNLHTYKVGIADGETFLIQRGAVICKGTHPDHGVVAISISDGTRVQLIDGTQGYLKALNYGNMEIVLDA